MNVPRVGFLAIISLFSLILGSSHFIFAQSDSGTQLSFLDSRVATAESSALSSSLVEKAQDVSALYEHNVVTSALQAMRVIEGVKAVPAVTLPTNDMANFPSAEHSLYPHYLAKRYSQFSYTVNSDGIVGIDAASPTTACDLEQIVGSLNSVE
jgi:hypothetical protein